LSFLQTVLDASFLALLQHVPAHRVLRKVLARIEPEIRLTEQVETLRGPLELFARAQAKAVRDGKEGKKEVVGDWRQRRRLAHERSGMAVGVYQLEELVL
jgi:gephyrin